jgi:flagellar basal-body rod protein FlgG
MRALYTAATGMMAQELNVQVISNNIANMQTTGYKRQRAQFQDLLYQDLRRAGTTTSQNNTMVPAGLEIGSGVKAVSTPRDMSQGTLTTTNKSLDIAIRGDGFFQVQMPDGTTAYTRDGSFQLDPTGAIVTQDGYAVQPAITVPNTATAVTINNQGLVQATIPGQTQPQTVGQLQLARFVNSAGLQSSGNNLYIETAASGPAQVDNAGDEGAGTLLQGSLEGANVNAVSEISDLIAAQRAYEMNAKVVSTAEAMLDATNNLR